MGLCAEFFRIIGEGEIDIVDLVVREALKIELKTNILKSVKYATGL